MVPRSSFDWGRFGSQIPGFRKTSGSALNCRVLRLQTWRQWRCSRQKWKGSTVGSRKLSLLEALSISQQTLTFPAQLRSTLSQSGEKVHLGIAEVCGGGAKVRHGKAGALERSEWNVLKCQAVYWIYWIWTWIPIISYYHISIHQVFGFNGQPWWWHGK